MEADPNKKPGVELFLKAYEKNERFCYTKMDGCFAQNDWCMHAINERYHYPLERIINVGFGINASYYTGEKDYANPHLLIILRKGTEHIKGLDFLLEAFKIAKQTRTDLRISVVGTEYTSMDGVTYYYNEPRSVTLELLKMAILYVMPAIREPNGITYLEALANKTPIMGLDRFAFPEFAGYGKYGFVAPNDNPADFAELMLDAVSDVKRLEQMGRDGQEFVKSKYNWDDVTDKMMVKFRSILDEK